MTEIVVFHHALGLTPGVLSFADRLRAAGHVVHTPDLYEGKTFTEIDDGVGNARAIGFGKVIERGTQAAEGLPSDVVYVGFSLGVMSAQALAQTRPGAKGALFFYSFISPEEFGEWPQGLPVQIHMMERDESVLEGDLDAAREFMKTAENAELFLYAGDKHLFVDDSTRDYDEAAAKQATERALGFLKKLG